MSRGMAAAEAIAAMERMERAIAGYGSSRAIVAFSGGVDSAVVVALAARALGASAVTAVTAVSPSYAAGELEAARDVARSVGVAHRTVETQEVEREAYARNDAQRCFHCKTELFATLERIAEENDDPGAVVLAGANADDLADFRPGLRAGERLGVRNPLLEEGAGKPLIRAIAVLLHLAVADKPALACLSSRVAYGIRITPDLLGRIDRAEQLVRGLGFATVRVRHLGATATVEVAREDVPRLSAHPGWPPVRRQLQAMGWADVPIDPEGYRTGSLNLISLGRPIPG